jgi:pSer/pThr/pTyr-binding forkhead associated (FHA) protein
MAKIVLLSPGMAGRTHDLKVEKTTIGRLDDNTFQIAEPSVSSHHAEILLKGDEVLVRDLNSTNGTFINGEKVTESVLKVGQILRLGQVEMRLEGEAAPPSKKQLEHTMVITRGVTLTELEKGGARAGGFDTASAGFSRKDNKLNKVFVIAAVVFGLLILGVLGYLLATIKQ